MKKVDWGVNELLGMISSVGPRRASPNETRYRRGQTLIEIMVLLLALALGVTGAVLGGGRLGVIGYILGAPTAIACAYGLIRLLALLEGFLWGGIPRFPNCRSGRCRREDYEMKEVESGDWVHQCRCGARYIKRGRRYLEVDQVGIAHPYMKWVPVLGWKVEK